MRTLSEGNVARSSGAEPEPPEQAWGSDTPFSFPTIPSELFARLDADSLVVDTWGEPLSVADYPRGARELSSAGIGNGAGNTTERGERDFWAEVAALSHAGVVLPSNVLGAKPDVVAYAIATVSAKYSFALESKPGAVPGARDTSGAVPRAAQPQPTTSASSAGSLDDPSTLEPCDLATVLESLLDFEQAAMLTEIRDLDATTFGCARNRAALAVVAAHVIQNSALKAVEGRRG